MRESTRTVAGGMFPEFEPPEQVAQVTVQATVARPVFRVLGTTDEVTECELCGRVDLKGTIMLAVLDEDGTPGEVVYYGAVCGARAAGWTTKDIRKAAKTADDDKRRAEREHRDAEHSAWLARRDAWIVANVGPDALNYPRRYGYRSPLGLINAYLEATGEKWFTA